MSRKTFVNDPKGAFSYLLGITTRRRLALRMRDHGYRISRQAIDQWGDRVPSRKRAEQVAVSVNFLVTADELYPESGK